jgi:hypothetical protein
MTLVEFSAWFEGFTESLKGPPDEKQWERIKARVKEIDNKPITERIFIDHYYPAYRHWLTSPYYIYPTGPYYTPTFCSNVNGVGISDTVNMTAAQQGGQAVAFNSTAAMTQLGQMEAQSLVS